MPALPWNMSLTAARDLEIPEKRRSHIITKDLFLFACYTGTAYADAVSITRENLFTDDGGSLRSVSTAYPFSRRMKSW